MVERRIELDRRYTRKKKMRKLKAKLETRDRRGPRQVLYKIKRLSPFWTEPAAERPEKPAEEAGKEEVSQSRRAGEAP